jgi:hypothetical protein
MPGVSIVIVSVENSGRERRLAEVVQRLQQQADVEQEIILVWLGRMESAPGFPGVSVLVSDLCSSGELRNLGAAIARHPFLSFFDDDTFPVAADHLSGAVRYLDDNNLDFLTCNVGADRDMPASAISEDVSFNLETVNANMWEPGLLIRREAFAATRFDATLGIGCLHGSSEGLDLGIRLLKQGYRGRRVAAFVVDHPPLDASVAAEKALFYSLGNGAVLLQHGYRRRYAIQLAKTVAKLFIGLISFNAPVARNSFIRLMALVAGPLLPRRPARILPASYRPRPPTMRPRA